MKKALFSDFITGFLVLLLILAASLAEWYPLELIEYKTYDLRVRLRRKAAPAPVTLIAIDPESIRKIGPWPWPRAYIALAINRLHDYGVKIIGVDILYSERDISPGLQEIREVIQRIETEPRLRRQSGMSEIFAVLKTAEKKLDSDSLLATTLAQAKNAVLPLSFVPGPLPVKQNVPPEDYLGRDSLISQGGDFIPAANAVLPLREFSKSALGLGHINYIADKDGTIRSEPLFISYAGRLFPSFALQLAMRYLDQDITKVIVGRRSVRVGDITIPVFRMHELLAGFDRDSSYLRFSFSDLLEGKIPAGALKDRIALLGCTAPGTTALLKTPVGESSPAVAVAPDIIGTILNRTFLARPDWAFPLESGMIVISGILLAVIPRSRARTGFVIAAALSSAWACAALLLFLVYGYWLKIVYPVMLPGVVYACLFAKRSLLKKEPAGGDSIESGELTLVISAKTDSGLLRRSNEDSFCIERESGLFAVADGVGGQASGEVASKMAIDAVSVYIREAGAAHGLHTGNGGYSGDTNLLGEAVRFANREIHEASHSNPLWQKMGTTIAAALLRKHRLSIAHVGDSRVYLARAGCIEQLTDDHNLKGSSTRHILTKALGICSDVDADLNELTLSGGDALILCTDGLSTMISDNDILAAVKSTRDPVKACSALVRMANGNGGKDNVTVIVAYAHRRK